MQSLMTLPGNITACERVLNEITVGETRIMIHLKSYWITAGKLTLLQRILVLAFGVLTFIMLVRIIDQEGYGVWMLYISLSTMVHMTREGFLKKPLIRYLNKLDGEEKKTLNASSLLMNLIFSVASSALLLVLSHFLALAWDAPGLKELFYIYFITNLFWGLFSHCNNLLEAHFQFKGPLISNMLKSASFFGFVVYMYFTGGQVDTFLLGIYDCVATILATCAILLYSKRLLCIRTFPSRYWAFQLYDYGKYTLGTNVSAILLKNTDIWMLGWFISPAAVAVYNVAMRIANLFEVPTMAMATIIFPQAVKKAEKEGDSALKELYEKSVTLIMLFMIPMVIVVIYFSNDIVRLLAGEAYMEAGFILNITMLYGLLAPFNKQMGILLDAMGKAKTNMLFVLRNAVINIILNAVFIPLFGIIGAAYATLTTMILVSVINQVYLHRNFNVEMKNLLHYSRYFFLRARSLVRSR